MLFKLLNKIEFRSNLNFCLFIFDKFVLLYLYNKVFYQYYLFVSSNFSSSYFLSGFVRPYWLRYQVYSSLVSVFFNEFVLDGVYFRVKYYGHFNIVGFILGYNHYILYKLPSNIRAVVHMKKRRFVLYCSDLVLLNNVSMELVNLKFPNLYKGKGVRLLNRFYRRKSILKKTKG